MPFYISFCLVVNGDACAAFSFKHFLKLLYAAKCIIRPWSDQVGIDECLLKINDDWEMHSHSLRSNHKSTQFQNQKTSSKQ